MRDKFIKRDSGSGDEERGDGFGGIVISKVGMGGDKYSAIHTGNDNVDVSASIRLNKTVNTIIYAIW